MKKILYLSLLLGAMVSFSSCSNEEDDLFSASAAERLNEMKELYSARLWASPNGWVMQYYPTYENEAPYGNGYLMLCDFNKDYSVRVAIYDRIEDAKGNVSYNYREDTSAWEILTDNGPVLSFNSYNNVMHTFSDPEDIPSTSTSEQGKGYEGDYEFVIVNAPEDASFMMLKGKKRGTYSLLTPMEEGVEYVSYLDDVRRFQDYMFAANSPTFNVMHFGDNIYKMDDANDGIPNIYPYDGDAVLDESFNPFLITKRGDSYYLRFRDERKVNDNETVQDFRYDTERDIFVSVDNEAYYIDGDSPVRFFEETMNSSSLRRFDFKQTSTMSSDFKTIIDAIRQEMRAKKVTLRDFSLMRDGDNFTLRVHYSQSGDANAYYIFTRSVEGNNVTFNYVGPKDTPATNLIANVSPSIQKLIDKLTGTYTVSAANTKFNLNVLRFTSTSNADSFINMDFYGNVGEGGEEA